MRERLRRFAVVGLVATAVDVLLLVGLRRAGCTLVVADLAALAAAALVARPMHRLVTLRDDPFARWIRSPGLFISVVLAAGSVDLLVLALLAGFWALLRRLKPGYAALFAVAGYAGVRLLVDAFRAEAIIVGDGYRLSQIVAWIVLLVALLAFYQLAAGKKSAASSES